jgi:hypothetical protein
MDPFLRSKHGPLAGYPDPLITLPGVPPRPPEKHPVNRPTSSSSNPPPQSPSGVLRRCPSGLAIKSFLQPAELLKTDVARFSELPPMLDMTNNDYKEDDDSDNTSDFGSVEGKLPVSLKQTDFSLNQFAKMMGQANYSAFNKSKKV